MHLVPCRGRDVICIRPATQVNVPKTKRAFCKDKSCKKHTVHKVTQYKTGKASLYAQGERILGLRNVDGGVLALPAVAVGKRQTLTKAMQLGCSLDALDLQPCC